MMKFPWYLTQHVDVKVDVTLTTTGTVIEGFFSLFFPPQKNCILAQYQIIRYLVAFTFANGQFRCKCSHFAKYP